MTGCTVASALQQAKTQLQQTDSPHLEARLLLCHLLSWSNTKLFSHSDTVLSQAQLELFQALVERRLSGEPSAYIVGERAFWSFDLTVTNDTLIPRPDTETLVELALNLVAKKDAPRILDMGTGSGAVALAIASERPDAQVEASDFCAAALDVAKRNATKLDLNIHAWHHGSWFEALPAHAGCFDLIVSNPPYIAQKDTHLEDLSFEPKTALVAGPDGLRDIRHLIENAPHYLNKHGHLALEHGYDQNLAVARLFSEGNYTGVEQRRDLGNNVRASAALAPESPNAQH